MTDRLDVSYDEERDILTVDGITYSGNLFRHFSIVTPPGRALRVLEVEDGVFTVANVAHRPQLTITELEPAPLVSAGSTQP